MLLITGGIAISIMMNILSYSIYKNKQKKVIKNRMLQYFLNKQKNIKKNIFALHRKKQNTWTKKLQFQNTKQLFIPPKCYTINLNNVLILLPHETCRYS